MATRPKSKPMIVTDAHVDTLILQQVREDPIDLAVPSSVYDQDLPRLRKGGVNCLFCMVGDNDLAQSSLLIDAVYEMCRKHPKDFALCLSAGEVRAACDAGKVAIVLTIEGQKMFGETVGHLRNWHRLGVRVASFSHGGGGRPELQYDSAHFGYLDPTARERLRRHARGLTPFARESLQEMGKLGLAIDVAHLNDAAFWDVMELAECPVCYTHGCCYSISGHTRGLTDEMMKALAKKGGVMGLSFWPGFIDPKNPTLDRLCDHFLHALEVAGPDCVGIGSDFDGCSGYWEMVPSGPEGFPKLLDALRGRGVDEATIRKIAGENFLHVLPEG